LVATADALLVGVPASTSASILEQFDRMLVMEDAEIEDASSEYEWSLAIGSECGTVSGAIAAGRLELFGLDEQALVFGAGTAPQLEAPELDEVAWTRLRLERGLPQFGVDFDDDDRPHEAALDRRAVDWKKGCYLGQEVVCMQDMRGKVSRSVFRLGFGADPAANIPVGTAVLDSSGTQLGVLSSVAYSERAERWLAMSQLPSAKTSEPLFVGAESGQLRAELVTDQF
jgi:folate-binding protein YgfZ